MYKKKGIFFRKTILGKGPYYRAVINHGPKPVVEETLISRL
jgi:hypothetical protein